LNGSWLRRGAATLECHASTYIDIWQERDNKALHVSFAYIHFNYCAGGGIFVLPLRDKVIRAGQHMLESKCVVLTHARIQARTKCELVFSTLREHQPYSAFRCSLRSANKASAHRVGPLRAQRKVGMKFVTAAHRKLQSLARIRYVGIKNRWIGRCFRRRGRINDISATSVHSQSAKRGPDIHLSRTDTKNSILAAIVARGAAHRHESTTSLHVSELQHLHLNTRQGL